MRKMRKIREAGKENLDPSPSLGSFSRSTGGAESVFDDGLAPSAAVSLVKMLEPIAVEAEDKDQRHYVGAGPDISKSSQKKEARSLIYAQPSAAKVKPE